VAAGKFFLGGGSGGEANPQVAPASSDSSAASSTTAGSSGTATASSATAATPAITTTGSSPPTTADTTTSQVSDPAQFVRNGDRGRSQVALTFHGAGDPALTDAMVAALRRASAPVTVFAVGSWLEENPSVATRLLSAGHELANHTYTHPALGRSSSAEVVDEIARCRAVLARTGGAEALRWFRPSGIEIPTDTILARAAQQGYGTVVGYDVDSLDFEDPGADAVVANVEAALRPGSIVSLHLGHQDTVTAMPRLLALLDRRGLRPVTVSTLLNGSRGPS
jgi:peptidoglycan/xylan/chitin deacetylase (PgdA/CDA1 family)